MSKITLKDIAEKVGVSKTTVSMVLNNKNINVSESTRERIFKAAKDMNYIPNLAAKTLSTNKSESIGIIVPDIENPFFSEISRAIEDAANKFNYNIILCNSDNNTEKEEKYVQLLVSKLIDGVIFISGGDSTKSLQVLEENHIPFVLVDRYVENYEQYYGVYCSNEKGIEEGIKYLIDKNRKKIAFVSGKKTLENSKHRLKAYKNTMKTYNLYNENMIFEGDFSIEGGMDVTNKILDINPKIDAIFYSNDAMALGGMKILTRKKYKIPEDISIIGYDNIKIAHIVEPELTTVAQPIYDMGRLSFELLIDIINGEAKEKQIILEPSLIVRGTS